MCKALSSKLSVSVMMTTILSCKAWSYPRHLLGEKYRVQGDSWVPLTNLPSAWLWLERLGDLKGLASPDPHAQPPTQACDQDSHQKEPISPES